MAIAIIRLGTPRRPGEGLRIGTVRRPPRGVPRERHASDNWYDVWYPELAPSADLMATAKAAVATGDSEAWAAFDQAFRKELTAPGPRHALDLLAALSATADFALGCYCADESRCHRAVLRRELVAGGARIAAPD